MWRILSEFLAFSVLALCGSEVQTFDIPELQYINPDADPCDNFYEYTCGNYETVHPLPEGEATWNHFTILQEEIHDLVEIILKSEVDLGEPAALQKAKLAYNSCLDTDTADRVSLAEARIIKELGGWPAILVGENSATVFTWADVGDVVATYGIPMFFAYSVIPNLQNSSENVIYFNEDPLANSSLVTPLGAKDPYTTTIVPVVNPNRNYLDVIALDEYVTRSPNSTKEEPPFVVFITKLALRLRDSLGTRKKDEYVIKDIEEVMLFMQRLISGGIVENGTVLNPLSTITTIEALQNWTDSHFKREDLQLDWVDYFNHVFKLTGAEITKDMKILQTGTTLLYGVLNLLLHTDERVLKNFAIIRILTYTAADSDSFMREIIQTYYKNENFSLYPRDEYCLRKVLDYPDEIGLSMALTYEYQLYHFNVNNLNGAVAMIEDLEEVFQQIVNESDWIDDATKQRALQKAANMITLLAYPEFVETAEGVDRHYENLKVCAWDHSGNAQRFRSFRWANNLVEIGNPRDRRAWNISPLNTNAFYNRQNNRMLFPVAMLNPVFYRGHSVLDYGRIGAIIGHEITHGFDKDGRMYDANGTVASWWTQDTLDNFNDRIACFENQYGSYFIEEVGKYINGTLTLNENLADNGGIRVAYRAMKNLRIPEKRTVGNYSNDQLFFVAFGTMWCSANTDEYLGSLGAVGYAPTKFRVNGAVSNMPEFADAFHCPVGSNMNPISKCTLW